MVKHTYRSRRGSTGVCGVDIFRNRGSLIVMLTELNTNRGISVTNCFDELATDIALGLMELGLVDDPLKISWIEHYEGAAAPRKPWNGKTWDAVTMEWDGRRFRVPSWKPCEGDRFRQPTLGDAIEPYALDGLGSWAD